MWTSFIRSFLTCYSFPDECVNPLIEAAEKLENNAAFCKALNAYESGAIHTQKEFSAVLAELQQDTDCNDTTEFLLFLLSMKALRVRYEESGLPIASYDGVAGDLRSKLLECRKVKGTWGSFVASWFIGFFTLDRFVFGRLQYELISMPACISADGKLCFQGEPAVNMHIPSGCPLVREEVRSSMKEAARFYAAYFPNGSVLFTCNSWLLFPGHYQMLPETSGIRQFMDEFTLVCTGIFKPGDEDDLWRVFNTFDTDDLSELPQNTSLQRGYVRWLREGRPIGYGIGIRRLEIV